MQFARKLGGRGCVEYPVDLASSCATRLSSKVSSKASAAERPRNNVIAQFALAATNHCALCQTAGRVLECLLIRRLREYPTVAYVSDQQIAVRDVATAFSPTPVPFDRPPYAHGRMS